VIDTHAHLDACADPPDALLGRSRAAGVSRVISIGSGIESCRATLAIAEREAGVFAALGIHPHQAGGGEVERLAELRALLEHPRAVAVGETGLDYYRDYAPRDAQIRAFEQQLELASELEMPVVVHTRAAEKATAAALERFTGTVVMHCFSSPGLLETALGRDYYISFAGNITYPKAADLRRAAARVPDERILAETDCPYLSPQPRRGRPNEPSNVALTITALARARAQDVADLSARLDANASAAFSLP
jgi:TatD DNase family protein